MNKEGMTIEEAIETNREIHKDGTVTHEAFHKAIQLGIEGLDVITLARFAIQNKKPKAEIYKLLREPLPSETEE